MSHYSVLIIGKNPELQLHPYEELDLPPDELPLDPRAKFEIAVSAPDYEKKAREITASLQRDTNGGFFPGLAEKYRQFLRMGRIETIFEQWFGGQKRENGDWGHYRNPRSRWDWFAFGGRWAGKLLLKPGKKGVLSLESRGKGMKYSRREVDQARFGDIDWEKTRNEFRPFAVLKHGEWHEQGGMYFLGDDDVRKPDREWEGEISRLLEGVPAEETVSVYDCHI